MEFISAWLSEIHWAAVFQIIIIDILLGGDNAVVIALACRGLPLEQRKKGIFWGALGAIVLRVILIAFAVTLLDLPLLKFAGGILLLWIGVKLIAPVEEHGPDIHASHKLFGAIKTIVVADLVMSVDNVIAIAGAAEQAPGHHQMALVIFGLLVSVPFIVGGSQIILRLIDRFSIIVVAGGALLGWIAGTLMVDDPWIVDHLPKDPSIHYIGGVLGAFAVLVIAFSVKRIRNKKAQTKLS